MCGRLSLAVRTGALEDRFDVRVPGPLEPRYNVAPGEDVAVIRDGERVDRLEWGLVPRWADEPGSGHVNGRAETLAEKPSFEAAYRERRCLVLADGYYEWADQPANQPYRFTMADGEPFALAGLWERWEGDGEAKETVTIVTTEANEVVRSIHHRMPVILDRTEEARWLTDDVAAVDDLLDPVPAEEMRAYPVSDLVDDPSNDSPAVIEEVDPPEQRDLDEFT